MAVKPEVDTSPAINLDVLTVVVVDRSQPQIGDTPYVSNNFQPTIGNAIRQWATNKLVATGTTGEAIVVIRESSLKAQALPHEDDFFKRQQTSKYTGRAEVEIMVKGREGQGRVSAEASRFETLPETPSSLERQNAYYGLLNGLMRDLTKNLRSGINDHLGAFVVTAPIIR